MSKDEVYVTGGTGLLGTELVSYLKQKGHKVHSDSSKTINLTDKNQTMSCIGRYDLSNSHGSYSKLDCVYHLAARVGGVKINSEMPSTFFEDNIAINTNVIKACKYFQVPKVVSVLSTCVYPDAKYVTYPLTEDQLHNGPPHESNFAYAYAKRMLEVHSRASSIEHGTEFVTVIPNNLFGKNDNYSLSSGHVIPSLIRKIWEAKLSESPAVEIWGDGSPLREFTYAPDAAKILHIVKEEYDDLEPLNIGNTFEYSITEVATLIAKFLEFKGGFSYNLSKPMGQHRKPSSNEKLIKKTSWRKEYYTPFDEALYETCKWFSDTYPNVRGIK